MNGPDRAENELDVVGPIDQVMYNLHEGIGDLDDTLGRLFSKIETVLSPQEPSETAEKLVNDMAFVGSSLNRKLHDRVERIRELNRTVRQMIERIEL
jgi:hypothetical protein